MPRQGNEGRKPRNRGSVYLESGGVTIKFAYRKARFFPGFHVYKLVNGGLMKKQLVRFEAHAQKLKTKWTREMMEAGYRIVVNPTILKRLERISQEE